MPKSDKKLNNSLLSTPIILCRIHLEIMLFNMQLRFLFIHLPEIFTILDI
jgi:hypothetical protein